MYLIEPLVGFNGYQMDGNLLLEHVEALIDNEGHIRQSYGIGSQFLYIDFSNMEMIPVELQAKNTTLFETYTTLIWNWILQMCIYL